MTADDTTTTDPSDPVERLRRLGDQLALAPPVPAPSVEDLAGRAVGEAAVETPAPPPALEAPHQVRGPGRLPSGPPARSRRRRVGPSLALAAALVVVLGLVGATLFGSTASSKFSTVGSAVSDGTPGDASTGGGPALPQLPVLPPGNDPDPAGPTGPGDALGNGWSAFATSVSWLTAVALTVLPFAVTALVVLGGLRVRRRRRPAAA